MSLFANYIKERQNKEIIETEHGFATYFFIEQGTYIEDIYVDPDHRHSKIASKLADEIVKIAKSKNHTKLYGSVVPSTKNATISLKVLLSYGFRLDSATNNAIIMVKEI